jgi:hypothetical protein
MVAEEIVKEEKGLAARFPLMAGTVLQKKLRAMRLRHHP